MPSPGKAGATLAPSPPSSPPPPSAARLSEVFLASTGVIGEPLPAQAFDGVLAKLAIEATANGYTDAAGAIMTTDTFPKLATAQARLGGTDVTINGFAKGAGMIAPDMGTMLAFVFTDAPIAAPALQALLREGVVDTFNAVTIDGDTSTSDTLWRLPPAPRPAPAHRPRPRSPPRCRSARRSMPCSPISPSKWRATARARASWSKSRSKARCRKLSARRVALSIANSPLVKTAIAGEDANWGRVVMAVGKAGEPADRDRLSIWFNGIRVAHKGARDPDYDEAMVSAAMKKPEIALKVALGLGKGRDRVLTCDLTKEYVAINGDYRS